MSSKFEAWKKTRGVDSKGAQSTLSSGSTDSKKESLTPPPLASQEYPGLTAEAVSRLNNDYRSQLYAARSGLSRAPSVVSSVKSSASTTSMIERLAKVEAALTTMSQVARQQSGFVVDLKTMIARQERLIELLSARVIGETVAPDESASSTGK